MTEHSPNTPVYLPLGPQGISVPPSRTTLSASQKLYSIWLADLVQRQQLQKVDAPHLEGPDLSFIVYLEGTHLEELHHPEHLLSHPQPRPRYQHSWITLSLFTHLWQYLHQCLFHHNPVPIPAPRI